MLVLCWVCSIVLVVGLSVRTIRSDILCFIASKVQYYGSSIHWYSSQRWKVGSKEVEAEAEAKADVEADAI